MKKIISILIIASLFFAPMAEAQDPARKLFRGVVNLMTGWVEIPKNIYDTTIEENILSGFTAGTVKGVGMCIVRTGVGVYEIFTFPFPVPENYEMVMYPEFIFSDDSLTVTEIAEKRVINYE